MCFRVTLVIMVLLYVGHSMWPDPLPGQIKSNQIYFSTTFNITFMCTLLHYYNLKFISIMIVNV